MTMTQKLTISLTLLRVRVSDHDPEVNYKPDRGMHIPPNSKTG